MGFKSYFDKSLLDKYKCNFLILVPLLNFNSDPFICHDDGRIRIIYFKSNLDIWGTDIEAHKDEWKKLKNLIEQLYNFNIENRDE
jgi:hypothetical protein